MMMNDDDEGKVDDADDCTDLSATTGNFAGKDGLAYSTQQA